MPYNYDYKSGKSHLLYRVMRPLANIIVRMKYKITYVGKENIPTDRGVILAANHQMNLDPVIISVGCKTDNHFMAKRELFQKKSFGCFLAHLNAFPVDRSKFDMNAIGHAVQIVKNGGVLGIFPEGTRSKSFTPQKAKGGVCYVAKACKCDVVPVSIYSSDMGKSGTKLTVRYGKPIKYDELGFHEDTDKLKDLRYGSSLIMDRITKQWELGHAN